MLEDGGDILLALRLSYYDLSVRLKQLLAYCCLIPKDYVFQKDDLILLCMAEGFLHNSGTNKSMERLGEEYFQELLSRSFFQHVPDDESSFVMHDLMNDLATFVAGEFYSRLDIDVEKNVRKEAYKKYRHMSFACEEFMTCKKFKAFERANSLRTFLVMPDVLNSWQTFYLSSKILADILPQLPLLRVLSLSRLNIDEVPECIGSKKHLRYLNLSETRIKHLPEIVCNLYNLQTLIVSGCHLLITLPKNFLKLKHLQHFDIRDTLLWDMMPLGISEMRSLQILSNMIVVENNDFFISWLKNLRNLQGNISIERLDKVQSARDIRENEVMNALKPHSDNLEDLFIGSYGGKVFPNWIEDPSFLLLTSVRIWGCRKCTFLPPLGQLPSLKKLEIQSLHEVKVVGSEFLGTGIAFPKLESLSFANMSGWEDLVMVWRGVMDYLGAVESQAKAINCSKLSCQNLVRCKLPNNIHELNIFCCDSIASVSFPILGGHKLKSLIIDGCEQLLEKELLKPSMPAMLEVNFPPSLVELRLWGGSAEKEDVSSGSQLSHMLPSSLTELHLCYFGKKWYSNTSPPSNISELLTAKRFKIYQKRCCLHF
ncbi:NB-ARC domains-containing protein [Tanacetum coccineum]